MEWKRLRKIGIFAIIFGVMLIPWITKNGIYQTLVHGSDMKTHVAYMTGQSNNLMYGGELFLKWIFAPFDHIISADNFYVAFNFATLFGAFVSIYTVMKKLVNETAAWLSVTFLFTITVGILLLFKYGIIFNIFNMYIIFPFAMLFMVYWLKGKGWWYGVTSFILFGAFSVFHVTGLYLPGMALIAMAGYVLISFIRHKWWQWRKMSIIAGMLVIFSVLAVTFGFTGYQLDGFYPSTLGSLYHQLSYFSLILLGITCIGLFYFKAQMKSETKILLFILGAISISMIGGLVLKMNPIYYRIAIDTASMITLIIAVMLSHLWKKNHLIQYSTTAIILIAAIPNIIAWIK